MSISFPPEIFDLVVEHLHGEQATLEVCSIVSKSWVARARRHLFARVQFTDESAVESWAKAFPDPSNSPAHHVRDLSIRSLPGIIAATATARAWIHAFCNIANLTLETSTQDDKQTSLVSLHALSPTLKSFKLIHSSVSSSEIFNLICSFPSLEDLSLISIGGREAGTSTLPPMSPKFTGHLCLVVDGGIRYDIWRLLALPGGLHFTDILVGCFAEDLESITSLVSACRYTLESFTLFEYFTSTSWVSGSLDLSTATNLKKVVFEVGRPSVRWVVVVLQTVKSKNLQQIIIHRDYAPSGTAGTEEDFALEWQDLDCLLVQFWTSHSIRPTLTDAAKRLGDLVPTLFPGLTRRGLLDIV